MPTDPVNFLTALLTSSPILAAVIFSVWMISKWFGAHLDRMEKRDVEREARYHSMVDAQLKLSAETVEKVTTALTSNTDVLRDVRYKLNEKSH